MLQRLFSTAPSPWVYVTGAFVALVLALFSALNVTLTGPADARSVAAIVNGKIVPTAEYVRALDAMQAGLERPLNEEDRERALTILIDEELIVQHALELDLARNDRLTRKTLIQALVKSSFLSDGSAEPGEDDLRQLFESEQQLFGSQLFLTVRIVLVPDGSENENSFTRSIAAGVPFTQAAEVAAFQDISPPPQLPPGKLADYAGASVRDVAMSMTPGDIAGPLAYGQQQVFIWLTDKTGGEFPDFASVEAEVRSEWIRRHEENAFEQYVDRLRRTARITMLVDSKADAKK